MESGGSPGSGLLGIPPTDATGKLSQRAQGRGPDHRGPFAFLKSTGHPRSPKVVASPPWEGGAVPASSWCVLFSRKSGKLGRGANCKDGMGVADLADRPRWHAGAVQQRAHARRPEPPCPGGAPRPRALSIPGPGGARQCRWKARPARPRPLGPAPTLQPSGASHPLGRAPGPGRHCSACEDRRAKEVYLSV